MAPASNEEQFKFLISCIRYSNNGKVDFGQVAKECSIVSKGAAAKRYERMMRAHGIASNAASVKPSPTSAAAGTRNPKPERTPSGSLSTNARKRKADQFIEDPNPADDDEGFASPRDVKAEVLDRNRGVMIKKQMCVKEENTADSGGRDRKGLVNMHGLGHGSGTQQGLMGSEEAQKMLKFYGSASEEKEGLKGAGAGAGEEEYFDVGEHHYSVPAGQSSSFSGQEVARMGGSAIYGSSPSPHASGSNSYGHSTATGYGMSSPHHRYSYKGGYEDGALAYGGSSAGMGMGMGMGAGMHTSSPSQQQMGFQPSSYRSDTKGRQESPLLVE